MTEFPGILPWHFGGDECLSYTEAKAFHDVYNLRQENRAKEAKEMNKKRR